MPYYSCPNCGATLTSAAESAPAACPGCCALLHTPEETPAARPRRRPAPALRMPLDTRSDCPGAARHALRELRPELGDSRFRVCELLVSELVTNVVRHTPAARTLPTADLRVRLWDGRVRVEVRDDGPGFTPGPRTDGQDADSGWGLQLVDRLSDDWGIERGVPNCVWFELAGAAEPVKA